MLFRLTTDVYFRVHESYQLWLGVIHTAYLPNDISTTKIDHFTISNWDRWVGFESILTIIFTLKQKLKKKVLILFFIVIFRSNIWQLILNNWFVTSHNLNHALNTILRNEAKWYFYIYLDYSHDSAFFRITVPFPESHLILHCEYCSYLSYLSQGFVN